MLPALREALHDLQREKQKLDELRRQFRGLTPAMRGNGQAGEAADLDQQIRAQILAIRTGIEEIGDAGVLIKDIDQGLVDFPAMREGRVVYLCWMVSEPDIAYWHDIDAGFQGRHPL